MSDPVNPGGILPSGDCGEAASPPGAVATVKVTVFHNVETDAGGLRPGFFGYQPGHALVRVFEAEIPGGYGSDPQDFAELMFKIGNALPDYLAGLELKLAGEYQARGLRSLSLPGNSSCYIRSRCVRCTVMRHLRLSSRKSTGQIHSKRQPGAIRSRR